jgi:condensin complex subunit 1
MDASTNSGESDPSAYTQHKEALEMYAFLLLWFVQSAEKLARSNGKDGEARAAPKAAKVCRERSLVCTRTDRVE